MFMVTDPVSLTIVNKTHVTVTLGWQDSYSHTDVGVNGGLLAGNCFYDQINLVKALGIFVIKK